MIMFKVCRLLAAFRFELMQNLLTYFQHLFKIFLCEQFCGQFVDIFGKNLVFNFEIIFRDNFMDNFDDNFSGRSNTEILCHKF